MQDNADDGESFIRSSLHQSDVFLRSIVHHEIDESESWCSVEIVRAIRDDWFFSTRRIIRGMPSILLFPTSSSIIAQKIDVVPNNYVMEREENSEETYS